MTRAFEGIPSFVHTAEHGQRVVDLIRRPHAGMGKRNGVAEQDRSRVIGIAIALDDLCARVGHILARNDAERCRAVVNKKLRWINIMIRTVGGTLALADGAVRGDGVRVLADGDIDQSAPAVIGGVGKREIQRVEVRGVVFVVEYTIVHTAHELA